jgi:hypothetical protein
MALCWVGCATVCMLRRLVQLLLLSAVALCEPALQQAGLWCGGPLQGGSAQADGAGALAFPKLPMHMYLQCT